MSNHSSVNSLHSVQQIKSQTSNVMTNDPKVFFLQQMQQESQQIKGYHKTAELSQLFTQLNLNGNNNQKASQSPEISGARKGRCKWFNVAKGWGFITPIGGGPEVFVHQSVIQMSGFRSLAEQEEVEYECKMTERGLEATRVTGKHGNDCNGSDSRPHRNLIKKRMRRIRCYNCGEFANHIASKCELGPQPKRCHQCKQTDHLFANCPIRQQQQQSQCGIASPAHVRHFYHVPAPTALQHPNLHQQSH